MHIVQIATELTPLAKVGGLGDVLLGLSRAIAEKGHQVTVIIPHYACINLSEIAQFTKLRDSFPSFWKGEWTANTLHVGKLDKLTVYFIDSHHPTAFFRRGKIYGCKDDFYRFLYFSRAAVDCLKHEGITPDVIHIHDWPLAPVAPLIKHVFPTLTKKVILTIHNISSQGKCYPEEIESIGLDSKALFSPNALKDNLFPGKINLLKGGIVFADRVNTVSPTYAKEVLTKKEGYSLETTLRKHLHKFSGILNGLDDAFWNPEADRYLPAHFCRTNLSGKEKLKKTLRKRLHLVDNQSPIVACVARLVPQKGIALIKHALHFVLKQGGQFVLLGRATRESVNRQFEAIKKKFATNPNLHITLDDQEELAHLIFAASDMFIVPSLFEPCGLTQMIALKYGTVPIVRKTGGLADTIFDVDHSGKPIHETNGYTFDAPKPACMEKALKRALACWKNDTRRWQQLIENGMQCDLSWNRPSEQYLALYS